VFGVSPMILNWLHNLSTITLKKGAEPGGNSEAITLVPSTQSPELP
jgi:hypothetical protein